MKPFSALPRLRHAALLLGSICVLLGPALIGLAFVPQLSLVTPVRAQESSSSADDEDGLSLFEAMMPAFTSPRCVNCHGGVDVITGRNHGGGAIDGAAALFSDDGRMTGSNRKCLGCHVTDVTVPAAQPGADNGLGDAGDPADNEEVSGLFGPVPPGAVGPWRLAPRSMSFVGKDARELCEQMRAAFMVDDSAFAPGARSSFDAHLQNEPQVGLAFQGGAGGISDPQLAPPPPMTQDEMVAAAQRWETEGNMACAPTGGPGTISYVSDSQSDNGGDKVTHFDNGSSRTNSLHSSTRTQVDVTLKDGVATADVTVSFRQDVGLAVSDKCSVQNLTSEVDQYQGSGTPTVQIGVEDDGTYSIYVAPQELQGTRTSTQKTTFSGACDDTEEALKLGNSSTSEPATIRPESFEIDGSASGATTLSGSTTETHGPTTITETWNVAAHNAGYSPDPQPEGDQ